MAHRIPPAVAFAGVTGVFAAFFVAAGAPTPLLSVRQQEWGFSAGALTIAFAVYAFALLAALLVGGSLSDHVGRRPVMLVALSGELAAMVVFLLAPDIGWVVVARAVQGLATGLATSAFSAAIPEHAPERMKRVASGIAAASVAGGLGLGALLTGAAVQLTAHANTVVFGALAGVMAGSIVFVALTAETSTPRGGALRSLSPSLGLPAHVRGEFLAGVPVHVAGWMFPAFFLGLSPSLLRLDFHLDGGVVTGFTAFLGPFTAAVSSFVFASRSARHSAVAGMGLVLAGALVVLLGVSQTWLGAVWLGALLGGAGFGAAFGAQIRLVAPRVGADERAGVLAGIYTAGYLAFGVPVILAGQLAPRWGLVPTAQAYVAALAALAGLAIAVQLLLLRREASGAPAVPAASA